MEEKLPKSRDQPLKCVKRFLGKSFPPPHPRAPTVPVHFWYILPEPVRAEACQDVFTPSLDAQVPVSLVSAPPTMRGSGAAHEALPGSSNGWDRHIIVN